MADPVELLECPLCDFAVMSYDKYVIQLHFEQVHTEDSPFKIEDDPGPPAPPLPPRPSERAPSLPPRPSEKRKKGKQRRTTNGDEEEIASSSTASSSSSSSPSSIPAAYSSDEEDNTVLCPEPDCREVVSLDEFNDHLDYHTAETLSFDEKTGTYRSQKPLSKIQAMASAISGGLSDTLSQHSEGHEGHRRHRHRRSSRKRSKSHRARSDTGGSEKSTLSRSILTFNPFVKPDKKIKPPKSNIRLGRAELGPYAWEERMPKWLYNQLDAGPKITVINRIGRDGRLIKIEQVQNETPGIIPILAQLSALDHTVKEAYYCHPAAMHIGKTPREGGFCGYRNIQMLVSYIQGAKAQGHDAFPGRTPGILELQDVIEKAWDKGINEIGRQQTGGVKGTRKYIGTPEAQAVFLSTEIDCAVEMFCDSPGGQTEAHEQLLLAVERYFGQAAVSDGSNVYKTLLPPIYLQQPGHSITIVGFERRKDGSCNLMVYDPMYSTSPAMHKLIGRKHIKTPRPEVMHAYRRVAKQLRHHAAFEILMLTGHPPLFPAWDVLRQFPDCRFLYVFYRSLTLGYDVYPEDHFLSNFPWHQYGGLWLGDEARFARAPKLDLLTAHALRTITSMGSSPTGSSCSSKRSSWVSGDSFHQVYSDSLQSSNGSWCQVKSPSSSFPSSFGSGFASPESDVVASALKLVGMQPAIPEIPNGKPDLAFLTDVGRRYPGYPTSLSPTRVMTRAECGVANRYPGSPRSVAGSEMGRPSPRYCDSAGFEHYLTTAGLDGLGQGRAAQNSIQSPPLSPSLSSSLSPTSPPGALSPRTAMLKSKMGKQNTHQHYLSPTTNLAVKFGPSTVNGPHPGSPTWSFISLSPPLLQLDSNNDNNNDSLQLLSSSPQSPPISTQLSSPNLPGPSIPIANGTETNTASAVSPSGTMLAYTSNRFELEGLLGVKPLTEKQVAEYRFWMPCGRRVCAFGCGRGVRGEVGAGRRLFREVEDVVDGEDVRDEEEEGEGVWDQDGFVGVGQGVGSREGGGEGEKKVWVDWNVFMMGREREGVASV